MANSEPHQLKRVLGRWNLTSLGIGAIIGAGIFVLTGTTAAYHSGPAIILSFIVSAIVCGLAGLCYAEFAAMIPFAGSAYTYALSTLGKQVAWIIGWDLILEYLFASATVAVGWSGYMKSFLADFGLHLPTKLSSAPVAFSHTGGWQWTGAILNVPAMLIVLALSGLLYVGIKQSAVLNNVIVLVKLTVIILFIGFGIFYINWDNFTPFIPQNTGVFGQFGWSGVMQGAAIIFFAYIGFDAVSTAAQEAKNPQKDMPFGILGSLLISTLLYIAVAFVLTGLVPYTQLGVPDPIAVGVNAAGPQLFWLRPLIKIGAIAGLSSVILVMLMGQVRIFYAMARDGFLPAYFAKIHPAFHTPYHGTLITGLVAAVIAGTCPIGLLGELVSIGTLLAFGIVCVSVLVLRYKRPDLPRPFRVPFVPFIPVLGALVAFGQMAVLPFDTWLRLIVWMVIGAVIYAFYGRKVNTAQALSHIQEPEPL
ncbi:MAG: amino acid permease [Candidatus Margulisiibacteriota bacterium]